MSTAQKTAPVAVVTIPPVMKARVLNGLASFHGFLESHDLPIERNPFVYTLFPGTDTERIAAVDRIAAMLGVEAGWMDEPHRSFYGCSRDFGGGVVYKAFAMMTAAEARFAFVPAQRDGNEAAA